jgi:oxygen-independent coproporphyrinogen-3 oxidase
MIHHLYVHIPFCHRICPYCGFHKHTPGGHDLGRFVEAVLAELAHRSAIFPLELDTIFLGGGTPTLLSRTHLDRLLTGLGEIAPSVTEWNVEANPATFGPEKAALLRERGVTRVSLGVQSFDAPTLETLGRDHSPDEAAESFGVLRTAGIPSVNIDLMFAIPGQSLASWEATLDRAIALGPDHLSAYNLTYEEDTPFLDRFREGKFRQDADEDAVFFNRAMDKLAATGFEHYEISNYARPGHRSRHNQAYWRGHDYLGLGPSAVSTVGDTRWKNVPDTALYVKLMEAGTPSAAATDIETLDEGARRIERVALELRTAEGMPVEYLQDPSILATLEDEGLLALCADHVVLTKKGMPLADEIAGYLLERS